MPDMKRSGPAHNHRATPQPSSPCKSTESIRQHAQQALRVAWLRVHAELLYDVDPGGQLSAQLYDFAHLLEALDEEGWWDNR